MLFIIIALIGLLFVILLYKYKKTKNDHLKNSIQAGRVKNNNNVQTTTILSSSIIQWNRKLVKIHKKNQDEETEENDKYYGN